MTPEVAGPFAAVIFDMDGLLIDSEPLHRDSFREVFGRRGIPWTDEIHATFVGTSERLVASSVMAEHPEAFDEPIEDLLVERQHVLLAALAGPLQPLPGVRDTIDALAAADIPLAVASSSTRIQVETALRTIGLRDAFRHLATGDEVERSKPAPDLYLLAARRLGVDPARCLVFEDSGPGVLAARAARCTVIAIPCDATRGHDHHLAALRLDSMNDARSHLRIDTGQVLLDLAPTPRGPR